MQLYQRYEHFVIIVLSLQNSKCDPNAVTVERLFRCCLLQAVSIPSPWLFASQRSALSSVFTVRTSGQCMGTFVVAIFSSEWISRFVLERNTLFVGLYSLFSCNYVMSHYLTSPTPNSVLIFLLAVHGSGSWSQACQLVGPGSILGHYMYDL